MWSRPDGTVRCLLRGAEAALVIAAGGVFLGLPRFFGVEFSVTLLVDWREDPALLLIPVLSGASLLLSSSPVVLLLSVSHA